MEAVDKWCKDFLALKLLDKKCKLKKNGATGTIGQQLQKTLTLQSSLQLPSSITRSQFCAGSCPNLMMNRNEAPDLHPVSAASTPHLPVRVRRPLCLSLSSGGGDQYQGPEDQDWHKSLQSQMEQAQSSGTASSTGSLERASLFCTSRPNTPFSPTLSGPLEPLSKASSPSRFSPSPSSSSSNSSAPFRSGSRRLCSYGRRGDSKAEDAKGELAERRRAEPVHFSEPIISRVTDCIYLGNLLAAYSGQSLCRNGIDSIIDMSSLASGQGLAVVPCTCTRAVRHSWSRLKVDLQGPPGGECCTLRQRSFSDINDCIQASAEKRKRVLVHCRDGYSLAPTCVIQYLMVKRGMRLLAAYELVRARYPVNIRECHQDLLVSLEASLRPGDTDPAGFKQAMSRKLAWT
ncbi:uncharacterized protein LOC115079371 [Rhinatrema bivittatum]|uniref:uncharacterized protein LOC115079371 n=1 Tax=Rhinatrema bivittatum TaxID=194408 RepID=UPI001127BECF|nr:uncharacterized protein LOC115079371 [Rhinatrema bivittatum]XP_029438752.1 uncharacterized protein LOC115079371 [Rhinatrema bivittatum]